MQTWPGVKQSEFAKFIPGAARAESGHLSPVVAHGEGMAWFEAVHAHSEGGLLSEQPRDPGPEQALPNPGRLVRERRVRRRVRREAAVHVLRRFGRGLAVELGLDVPFFIFRKSTQASAVDRCTKNRSISTRKKREGSRNRDLSEEEETPSSLLVQYTAHADATGMGLARGQVVKCRHKDRKKGSQQSFVEVVVSMLLYFVTVRRRRRRSIGQCGAAGSPCRKRAGCR